ERPGIYQHGQINSEKFKSPGTYVQIPNHG
ncbi:unnamed protein product, partial [marine sediment metagenome]